MNTTRLTTAWCGLASLKRQAMGGGNDAQGAAPNFSSPGVSLTSNSVGASAPAPLFITAWDTDGVGVVRIPVSPKNKTTIWDDERGGPQKISTTEGLAIIRDTRIGREIAKDYGISINTVWKIKRGDYRPGLLEMARILDDGGEDAPRHGGV